MATAAAPWDAIGAVAGVLSLLVTVIVSWRGGTRSTVSAKVDTIEGKIDGRKVTASKITLKNRGFSIQTFKVRIEKISGLLSAEVQNCSTLDKKNIKISHSDEDVLVEMDDLPFGEKVEIVIFSRLKVYEHEIIGGSSAFVIRSLEKFYFIRFNVFLWGGLISFFLYKSILRLN